MPDRRRIGATVFAVVITAGGLGACGGSSDSAAPATTTAAATTTAPSTTTTTRPAPSVSPIARLEVTYQGGTVSGGGRREVAVGKRVTIEVTSDVADEVHLHGYDRKVDVVPGSPAALTFVADIPGVFELELESRSVKLMDLVVR